MSEIYLLIENQQQGPYTEEQVRQSLAEGLIYGELLAWKDGLDHWVEVKSLIAEGQARSNLPRAIDPLKTARMNRPLGLASSLLAKIRLFDSRSKKGKILTTVTGGVLLLALITLLFPDELAKGKYRTSDDSQSLTIISNAEVEVDRGANGVLGRCERQGNMIRVVITVGGTDQVYSFTKVRKGWKMEDGDLFLSDRYFAARQACEEARNDNDDDQAIAALTKAIELDPYFAEAYGMRADCKDSKRDYDAAIQDYTEAIKISSDSSDEEHGELSTLYISRAMTKEKKGDYDGAMDDVRKSESIDPFDTGDSVMNRLKAEKAQQ